jgi:hypothetical protein
MLDLNPQGLKDWKHGQLLGKTFHDQPQEVCDNNNGLTILKQKQFLNLNNKMHRNFDGL